MKRLIAAIPTTSTHLQACHSVVNEEHHNIGISKGQRRNIRGSADPFWALIATARQLQAPGGCPWDQAQTISSLLPHLIEETWEAFEVVRSGHHKELQEELGDVLYTVLFLTLIAERRGLCRLETLLTKTRQKNDSPPSACLSIAACWHSERSVSTVGNDQADREETAPLTIPCVSGHACGLVGLAACASRRSQRDATAPEEYSLRQR